MVKRNTDKVNSMRSKKERSRRRGSRYSDRTENRCVIISLRDVGDIDDQELNTIPSTVQEESYVWSKANPNMQVESFNYCQTCTKKLLDINDGGAGDGCNHEGTRKHMAQSIVGVLQNITEGRLGAGRGNKVEREINHTQRRRKGKKHQKLNKVEEMKCSLSVEVICSKSTLSAAFAQSKGLLPSETTHDPDQAQKRQETVVDAHMMELCQAKAFTRGSSKKLLLAKDSFILRLKNARHRRPSVGYASLEARIPGWLKELCQRDSRQPILKTTSHIDTSKINAFRPLLCTKLSIPWLLPKSLSDLSCMKQHELAMMQQTILSATNDTKGLHLLQGNFQESSKGSKSLDLGGTTVVQAHNSNVRFCSSDSVLSSHQPTDLPLRLLSSKIIRKAISMRKKRPARVVDSSADQDCRRGRLRKKNHNEMCHKCLSSVHCLIAMPSESPKWGKSKIKAFPNKNIKIVKSNIRQNRSRRHQRDRTIDLRKTRTNNKYFIKSFITGTSTSDPSKPAIKTKRAGRRRKMRISGREVQHDAKQTRAPRRRRKTAERDARNFELDVQASDEMDIINQHVQAHKTTSPDYHTCFKRLLNKELQARSGRHTKRSIPLKVARGAGVLGRFPRDIKKFNEGILSCLIPKVFK